MSNTQRIKRFCANVEKEFGEAFATLVDVGAARGAGDRWASFKPLIKTIGFEPGKAEFTKLRNSDTEFWINTALSSRKETRSLYLTKSWSNTSLLRPNQALLDTLSWGDDHRVMAEESLMCESLDGVLKTLKLDLDFLKIDTQGTELEILQGATESLSSVLALEVEVEFAPLYQAQPLFSDVNSFLLAQGFYLQDLGNFLHVKPKSYPTTGAPKGRIISADALYFRDPSLAAQIMDEYGSRKIAALLIGYLAYGYPELCCVAIDSLEASRRNLPWLESAKEEILKIQHLSKMLRLLPCKRFLARLGRKFWQYLHEVNVSLWDSPLGNKLF
ncbi:MAG: FkbM family methyltransferase [Phycisphaerae bacterium]|jgi:FkbM family methyltransferase